MGDEARSEFAHHFAAVARGERDPNEAVDERRHESDRTVSKEYVRPVRVFRVHLVGVTERMVRRVNDDLRMVVRVGAAVCPNQTSGAVAFGGPAGFGAGRGERDGAEPSLVAQLGTVFTEKHSAGKSVGNVGRSNLGIAIERPVLSDRFPRRRDRFGCREIGGVGGSAPPRLMDARVRHVM